MNIYFLSLRFSLVSLQVDLHALHVLLQVLMSLSCVCDPLFVSCGATCQLSLHPCIFRALGDIQESIKELQFYRKSVFKMTAEKKRRVVENGGSGKTVS